MKIVADPISRTEASTMRFLMACLDASRKNVPIANNTIRKTKETNGPVLPVNERAVNWHINEKLHKPTLNLRQPDLFMPGCKVWNREVSVIPAEMTKKDPATSGFPRVLEILLKLAASLVVTRSIPKYSKMPYAATRVAENTNTINIRSIWAGVWTFLASAPKRMV
tara:strand:+ start:172 stop:669 length:498 start_codon:yes stop_codon:yes gene_type:complete